MYVCVCNAVSDTEIRDAIDLGAKSLRELKKRTGCGTQCGTCIPHVRAVLDECTSENVQAGPVFGLQVVPST
jgi:bacterioferritin-associated ferredoxin